MKKLILIVIGLVASTFYSHAAVTPQKISSDYRIVSTKYDPSNVILIRTKVGTATLIQLDDGETIRSDTSGVGMGDAKAWGFNVRGNNIFFKPTAKKPDTNLTVVSDKGRTYSFYLTSSKYPYYIVKMQYEKPPKKTKLADNKPKIPCTNGQNNFNYNKWGDDQLSPQYAWDDGRFTCMKFELNKELPVIYELDSDGKEALVNYHIEKDTVVIHSVADEYRLRLGDSVLGIKTSSIHFAGYNDKGTSIYSKRVIKDAEGENNE